MKQPSRARLLRISLIYAIATTIWIILTDRLTTLLTQDVEQQALLQTAKGLLFITFTASLIYALLRRELRLEEEVIAALGDSEAQWRSLVENAPDIIFTVNRQGDILFINHPVAGLTHQDVLGTNVLAYTPPEYQTTIREALAYVFETGQPARYEIEALGPHGTPAWYSTVLSPVMRGDSISTATLITRDITARRRAEQELRESEAKLKLFIEHAPVSLAMFDPDMRYLAVSRRWITDYSLEGREVIGQLHYDLFPELPERWKEAHRRGLAGKVVKTEEDSFERSNGTILWQHWEIWPWYTSNGAVGGIVIFTEDITARRSAQAALRLSEERYRQIVELAQEGIWVIDAENKTIFANARMAEMLGYTVEEMNGQPLFAFMDDEGRRLAEANVERRRQGITEQHEFLFQRKDGTPLWTFMATNPLLDEQGHYRGAQAMVTDITRLKQTQNAEHEQRMLAEALAQTANALSSSLDLDTVMNAILENITQVVPHDATNIMLIKNERVYIAYWRGYRPEFIPYLREFEMPLDSTSNLHHMWATGLPFLASHVEEYPDWVRVPPNEWVESYVAAPIRSHGNVIGFLNLDSRTPGFFTEVHVQHLQAFADQASIAIEHAQLYEQIQNHAAELEQHVIERTAQLNQTKERIEAILNSSSDVIILCQTDGLIEQTNPAFCQVFRCAPDESLFQPVTRLVIPEDAGRLAQAFQTIQDTRQTQRLEVGIQHKGGTPFDAELTLTLVAGQNERILGIVCTIHDISERKEMEMGLRAALAREKELNELKVRFVGMISHDVRTPLSVISSSTDILRTYHDRLGEQQRTKHLDQIDSQVKRMVTLLNDVLTISRADTGTTSFSPKPVNLNQYCRSLVEEFQGNLQVVHPIEFSFPGEVLMALVDDNLFYQALTNLLNNAIKYSPESSPVRFSLSSDGENAVLQIADNGIGIPQEDLPHLFEAFHRGSNVGQIKGTGLGLAIVKRSIEAHGGTVTCESQLDTGTTFTIRLPRIHQGDTDHDENPGD